MMAGNSGVPSEVGAHPLSGPMAQGVGGGYGSAAGPDEGGNV